MVGLVKNFKLQKSRPFTIIEEEVTVDGIIRKPQLKGYFVPKNDKEGDFWFTIKPNEIKKARELEKYSFEEDFFIDAIRNKNNRKLPIAALGNPNFRNQHLSYAITWYSLALTLVIIYFIFHIREKRLTFKKRKMMTEIKYLSTRGQESNLNFEDVLLSGLARDGGLYLPNTWPRFSNLELNEMKNLDYISLAEKIISPFVSKEIRSKLYEMCRQVYSNFNHEEVVPIKKLDTNLYIMELFLRTHFCI